MRLNKIKMNSLLILWTKNLEQQFSKLVSLENGRFKSLGSKILEIYVNKSQNHAKKY